jgi:hypothetical protein
MQFSLTKDTMTPSLKRKLARAEHPRVMMEAGAKAVQVDITKHLRTLQARGNEMGWPSQKFFAGGPNSVEKNVGIASVTDKSAVITIADPRFIHRITGGTVTAKRAGALTVPLTAEAGALSGKGSLRQSAPWLKLIKTPKGAFLVKVFAARAPEFMFLLLKSVTHSPHPNEAPDVKRLAEKAGSAMMKAARLLETTTVK